MENFVSELRHVRMHTRIHRRCEQYNRYKRYPLHDDIAVKNNTLKNTR